MKLGKEIVGIIILVLLTFCSCTSDPIDSLPILKKITEISVDGSSNTTNFIYEGNKIVHIAKVDKFLKFYYTGDLITKVEDLNTLSQRLNTLIYTYSNGLLTKITSSDQYVIAYIHNEDGSIYYEKITQTSNNLEVKNYHGVLYFQNGNLIKDERTFDDAGTGIISKNTISLEYDSKKNAMKNVLGFDKLLDYATIISTNNVLVRIDVASVRNSAEDQITSSAKRIDSQYKYNSNGYPIAIISENVMLGSSDSKHLKSQLFYN